MGSEMFESFCFSKIIQKLFFYHFKEWRNILMHSIETQTEDWQINICPLIRQEQNKTKIKSILYHWEMATED